MSEFGSGVVVGFAWALMLVAGLRILKYGFVAIDRIEARRYSAEVKGKK